MIYWLNTLNDIHALFPDELCSSVRTALEMALLDVANGGKKIFFDNAFARREAGIPTNGLIWIGGLDSMLQQVSIKIEEGFRTLKIKIGSLDFDKEIDILQYIKRKYFRETITIRLDANGAFLGMEKAESNKGQAYAEVPSAEQVDNTPGSFTVRHGATARYDERDGSELLQHAVDQVREESRAFASMDVASTSSTLATFS